MTFLKYLFYRIYSWNFKKWGARDLPQFNAVLGVSFLMYLNLLALAFFVMLLTLKDLPIANGLAKIIILLSGFALVSINYLIMVKDGKYQKIVETYQDESTEDKRKGTIKVGIYILSSFIIPIVIIMVFRRLNA